MREAADERISISVALAGEPSTTHRTSFSFRFTFLRMRELLLLAVMAMGKLPWVEVGAVVEDSVIDTGGEKKVLMDLVEGGEGTENMGKEMINRRKPPPYMIKLFRDHTRCRLTNV